MKALLFLIILFSSFATQAQVKSIVLKTSPKDSARVMENTRVTTPCAYMTDFDREVIQWLNIARMYPKWFIYFRKVKNEGSTYEESLYETLATMKPLQHKLKPDSMLWESEDCHVKTSGHKGHIGHDRIDTKCRARGQECVYYGLRNPPEIVKALLIDKGVFSLGHRNACLDKTNNKVGVSHGKHKTHDQMCAISFRR